MDSLDPSKIVRLDGCYTHDITDNGFNPHVEKIGIKDMQTPSLWIAPNSTLTPHKGKVTVPPQFSDVRAGVEFGIIMETSARNLDPNDVLEAIRGFTVCIDFAVHDDVPGLEGYRMFDTSLPCGPKIVDQQGIDPEKRALGIRVNGEPVDVQSTTSFRFSLTEMICYVSEVLTLSPGDLITTGTPIRGSPSLGDGDEVEAWIESIGTLQATVEWGKNNE